MSERIMVPSSDLVRAPAHLTDAEAATLPVAGLTAWLALQEAPALAGATVLIEGVGGVTTWVMRLARAAGASVIAVCGAGATESGM